MLPGKRALDPPTPAASGRGCTCFRLRRLTRRVTAVYNRALAPTGLRVTQYSVLAGLRGSAPVPLSLLAERLDLDRTTLTRNLKPLIEAGWVQVDQHAHDARVRLVTLTPGGEAHLQAARTHWKRAQQEVSATIGENQLATLHELLDRYVPLFRPAAGNEGDI